MDSPPSAQGAKKPAGRARAGTVRTLNFSVTKLNGFVLLRRPCSQDTVSGVTSATLLRGFERKVEEVAGLRTRYWVGGAGPPLVLVHGLGGAAWNFTDLAPLLARRRRVLVPDLPGHGGTRATTSAREPVRLRAPRRRRRRARGHGSGGLRRVLHGRPRRAPARRRAARGGLLARPRRARRDRVDDQARRALAGGGVRVASGAEGRPLPYSAGPAAELACRSSATGGPTTHASCRRSRRSASFRPSRSTRTSKGPPGRSCATIRGRTSRA